MPRLLDVANAAGVSLRTASRVLNDDPRVAPDTRQRVREAINDLSFSTRRDGPVPACGDGHRDRLRGRVHR